jgi:membrane associated rhomboid family serine protease
MGRLDALAAHPGAAPISGLLAAACVLVFLLQLRDPSYQAAGFFSALLVRLGEPWRLVTANFLHASPVHLVLNGLGLSLLGALAERSLGSPRLGPVLALAGLGAMAASYAAGYQNALGASGLVAGLAGTLLWLEFRAPEALPVGWRLPRRVFVGVLGLDLLVLMAVPGIAHAAHAGGFAAGVLGAAAVGPRLDAARPRGGLRLLNALALATVLLAGAAWVKSVRSPDPEALAERGEQLLARSDVPAAFLNDEAWRIAISEAPSAAALETARRMAERAANETGWSDPPILDTLAEIHFHAGRADLALELADEAVALAPDEPYYREQRRRFAGERASSDRPPGPDPRPPAREQPRQRIAPPAERGPGMRV